MQHEHAEEEHPTGQAIEVQQTQQIAVVHALGVHRNAHEKVGKGHAQQHAGDEVGDKVHAVPQGAPAVVLHLVAEFKGNRAEDEGKEQEQQGRVQRAEHNRIDLGKGRKGHAAGGNEPDFVAVPEGSGGVVHDAALGFVFAQERQQAAHAQVKTVQDEEHGPEQRPKHEPDGFQHGYTSWASGPLIAYLRSR